jgi:hypothetical protein
LLPLEGTIVLRLLSVVCAAFAFAACAQEPTDAPAERRRTSDREGLELPRLVTDRPDFTESTAVVGAGVIQVEGGVTLDREGSAHHLTQPEVLLRTGLGRRMEFRFGSSGVESSREHGSHWKSGMADATFGFKYAILDERHNRPAVAIIPILSVPTGASAFSSGHYEPTVKLAVSKDAPLGFSIGANFNVSSLSGESSRYAQRAASVTLGHALFAGFGGYWEVFAISPWEQGSGTAWVGNTGVSHAIGENVQLDVRVGKRMTSVGPNWFAGVGFAVRQPTRFVR